MKPKSFPDSSFLLLWGAHPTMVRCIPTAWADPVGAPVTLHPVSLHQAQNLPDPKGQVLQSTIFSPNLWSPAGEHCHNLTNRVFLGVSAGFRDHPAWRGRPTPSCCQGLNEEQRKAEPLPPGGVQMSLCVNWEQLEWSHIFPLPPEEPDKSQGLAGLWCSLLLGCC